MKEYPHSSFIPSRGNDTRTPLSHGLRNSVPKKTHSLNLRCKDKGTPKIEGKTEFEHFLYWFENTVKSGTIPFYLTDIVTGSGTKLYIIEVDGWTGQKYKEISIKLKEE